MPARTCRSEYVEQLVHRRLHRRTTMRFAELDDAALGQPLRSDLRSQVTSPLVGIAHVRDDEPKDVLVEHASVG